MKKVLGIVCSMRALGNSEVMVKQISRELSEPHELHLLRLPEFKLKYCNGCYRCLMTARGCVIKDDLASILDAIAEADALILATPTYSLSAHACLKIFIDRAISFYSRSEQLWGKPAVGIGIAGIEGKEGSTLLDIERFLMVLMAKNKRNEIIYGALPGEAALSKKNREIAIKLASALFAQMPSSHSGQTCPCCGGQTFRFYTGNKVRCMLCSESGALVHKDRQQLIEIEQSEHKLFASKSDALSHRQWLENMVSRFKTQKKALAKVRTEFTDEVEWIKPKE